MRYDAVIIGSGQGGNPLAQKLTDHSLTVALVERAHLGGTCINTGCTPTKTMVACAQVAHYARNAARWGVRTGAVSVDLPWIIDRKAQVVHQFRGGQQRQVDRRENLHLYRGHGRFVAPDCLQVGDEMLESPRFFINTGTRPEVPRIEGIDGVDALDNARLMELRELPAHLIVIGGGYIGLEFGQMFRRFGSRVTVVHRGEQLLAREDADVTEELQKVLEAEGIRFLLSSNPTRVAKDDGRVRLEVQTSQGVETLTGSHLLVATGRRANTDDMGLEKAGVRTDARGFVTVNGRLETNVPGIWALGDVKGGPMFTHISYNDYQILYANLIEGKELTIEDRIVPYAVFTDPQIGRVGMSESEARATGRRLKIGKIPMSNVARAIERDETAGLMKLVVDAETDQVLGAAIVSSEGGELIQTLHTLMLARAPYTLLKKAIYIHPTLAEGFWGLMEEVK